MAFFNLLIVFMLQIWLALKPGASVKACCLPGCAADLTLEQECFADYLVLDHKLSTIMLSRHSGVALDFVLIRRKFPTSAMMQDYLDQDERGVSKLWKCLTRYSPCKRFYRTLLGQRKQILFEVWEERIRGQHSIAPSLNVQRLFKNAQCLLDLGVLDGNIKFFAPQLHKFGLVDTRQWLNDLRSAQSIPISENGVEYLRYCLLESAEFSLRVKAGPDGDLLEPEEADLRGWKRLRLDRNGEHLRQALHVALHLVPFSPLLIREIEVELTCVADFLVKSLRAVTEIVLVVISPDHGAYTEEDNLERQRLIVGPTAEGQRFPRKIYRTKGNQREYNVLWECLYRRHLFLKVSRRDSKEYIDLMMIMERSQSFVVGEELGRKLDKQSECLAKFLAVRSKGLCLAKTGLPGIVHEGSSKTLAFGSWIMNFGIENESFMLNAADCGQWKLRYDERRINKGTAEFDWLVKCGLDPELVGADANVIDVPRRLGMHLPSQLFLRGLPVELFPTHTFTVRDMSESKEKLSCPICMNEFEVGEVAAQSACGKHQFHVHCLTPWLEISDRCPACRHSLLKIEKETGRIKVRKF